MFSWLRSLRRGERGHVPNATPHAEGESVNGIAGFIEALPASDASGRRGTVRKLQEVGPPAVPALLLALEGEGLCKGSLGHWARVGAAMWLLLIALSLLGGDGAGEALLRSSATAVGCLVVLFAGDCFGITYRLRLLIPRWLHLFYAVPFAWLVIFVSLLALTDMREKHGVVGVIVGSLFLAGSVVTIPYMFARVAAGLMNRADYWWQGGASMLNAETVLISARVGALYETERSGVLAVVKALRAINADACSQGADAGTSSKVADLLTVWDDALRNINPFVRFEAVEAFGVLGPAAVSEGMTTGRALVAGLGRASLDANEYVRRNAAEALWRLTPAVLSQLPGLVPELVAAWIQASHSRDKEVRRHAAAAFVELNEDAGDAAQCLVELLGDSDVTVRLCAAVAIRRIGPNASPVWPSLNQALEGRDESRRLGAASVLIYQRPARELIPVFSRSLRSKNEQHRRRASEGLARLGVKSIPSLIAALGEKKAHVCWAAIDALVELGKDGEEGKEAVRALMNAAEDASASVRAYAAEALGRIGPVIAKEAVPVLMNMLQREGASDQQAAAGALGKMGPRALLPLAGCAEQEVERANLDGPLGPALRALDQLIGDKDCEFCVVADMMIQDREDRAVWGPHWEGRLLAVSARWGRYLREEHGSVVNGILAGERPGLPPCRHSGRVLVEEFGSLEVWGLARAILLDGEAPESQLAALTALAGRVEAIAALPAMYEVLAWAAAPSHEQRQDVRQRARDLAEDLEAAREVAQEAEVV